MSQDLISSSSSAVPSLKPSGSEEKYLIDLCGLQCKLILLTEVLVTPSDCNLNLSLTCLKSHRSSEARSIKHFSCSLSCLCIPSKSSNKLSNSSHFYIIVLNLSYDSHSLPGALNEVSPKIKNKAQNKIASQYIHIWLRLQRQHKSYYFIILQHLSIMSITCDFMRNVILDLETKQKSRNYQT